MPEDLIVQRHYAKVEGLVPRTVADISPLAMEGRFHALDFLRDFRDPLPNNPRLISSAHGGIEELLLTIPAYAVAPPSQGRPNPLAQVYRDLLSKLPAHSKLIVLTHESVQSNVSRWLEAANLLNHATIIAAPDHLHFSIWAEDGYVVL